MRALEEEKQSATADRAPTKRARSAGSIANKDIVPFRRALLRWYDLHRRDLPWRKTRDPYPIWLSEIMLQQTRVAAVLEHYRIFLERFPDLPALAAASEESVLAAWSGLGYYRRARMMHQCARQIAEQHGGLFPENSKTLMTLPGIGRYTAAAIASIAFGEPVAVVDGNVERVLRRVMGRNLSVQQTWQLAQTILSNSRPGDFNQAMMELGAMVCGPRAPRCPECPVRKWCATRGEVPRLESAPGRSKKQIWCVLDWRNLDWRNLNRRKHGQGEVRMVQRPNQVSLMPGMWELPEISEPRRRTLWRTFRHSITSTDYTVHVVHNRLVRGRGAAQPKPVSASRPRKAAGSWIPVDHVPQLALTGLSRKILKAGGII